MPVDYQRQWMSPRGYGKKDIVLDQWLNICIERGIFAIRADEKSLAKISLEIEGEKLLNFNRAKSTADKSGEFNQDKPASLLNGTKG